MDIYQLASYTTERYYLLSELEQRATFLFLDEPLSDSSASSKQKVGNNTADKEEMDSQGALMKTRTQAKNIYYYVLWKYADGLEGLFNQLKRFKCAVSYRNKDEAEDKADHLKEWLCVECYISADEQRILINESDMDGSDTKVISDLTSWVQKNLPFVNITILGMCSSLIGTPSIECIFDQICHEHPDPSMAYAKEQQIIVSLYRVDCLGHNPAHEPDADSGVVQTLFTSTNYVRPETIPRKAIGGGRNEFFTDVTIAVVVVVMAIIVLQFLHPSLMEEVAMIAYLLLGDKETE